MATPTNLPASFTVGQVLTAAQMNGIRGAFRILQVLQMETSTLVSNASSTFVASGLSLSITPQATTSKILVLANSSIAKTGANVSNGVNLRVRRGSTVLQSQNALLFTGTGIVNIGTATMMVLDSPSSISSITYDVQFANFVNASAVEHNANGSASSLVLMEISA
jgi:hypothetical protein